MNKKKIFGSIAVLAIAAIAAFNININANENGLSDISLANVEALADGEGGSNGCAVIPDHYLTVKVESFNVISNSKGEINILGKNAAGFEANKQVPVIVAIYNCDGVQVHSNCNECQVRVEIVGF